MSAISNENLNPPNKISLWGLVFLVCMLVVWVFQDLTQFQLLLYDDVDYVTHRKLGWNLVYWIDLISKPVVNLWHPATVLSHDICALWKDGYSWKHHALNLLLHAANVVLIIWWLRQLGLALYVALAVSLLWFFHPVLVEPVAWVSGRKDLLVALFSILALGLAAKSDDGIKARMVIFFLVLAAVCSKPVAVVLPAVLVFQSLVVSNKNAWDRAALYQGFKKHGELFLLSLGIVLVTLMFQADGGQAVVDARTLPERLASALWAVLRSLKLWVMPYDLHTAYDDPEHVHVVFVIAGLMTVMALGLLACWNRLPLIVRIGLALFLLFLLPTMGLVRAGNHLVADRYLYLPGLGLTLVLGGILSLLKPRVFVLLFMFLTLGAAVFTKYQRQHWRDTRAVFSRILDIEPKHSYALAQMGSLERIAGNKELAQNYFLKALGEDAGSPIANWNLGDMEIEENNYAAAYKHYLTLAKLWGGEAWVHENLAKLAWNLQLYAEAKSHAERGLACAKTPSKLNDLETLLQDFEVRKR